MLHLSTRELEESHVLLQLGRQYLKLKDQVRTETDLRDRLIDRVSVGNLRHRQLGQMRAKLCGAATILGTFTHTGVLFQDAEGQDFLSFHFS